MIQFVQQETTFLGACPSDEALILRHIERCGRVAYKSEGRITDRSAPQFVHNMLAAGHHSVLEHSNIALGVTGLHSDKLYRVLGPRLAYHPIFYRDDSMNCVIAGNVRAWIDTMEFLRKQVDADSTAYRNYFGWGLKSEFPYIFDGLYVSRNCIKAPVICLADQMLLAEHDIPVFTAHITCDRGISHEIVRHRTLSFTQESTRYCNYSGGVTYILPDIFVPHWDQFTHTLDHLKMSSAAYNRYLLYNTCYWDYRDDVKMGEKPQIARDILPMLLKTELYVSGRWSAWKHFIELRSALGAHPRIREIARDLKDAFSYIGLKVE